MPDTDMEENEGVYAATQQGTSLDDGQQNKNKEGRKYTRKHNIHSRGNQPRLRVEINEFGQPVGDNASEFANFLATLVKNSEIISLEHNDWRLVDVKQKAALWKNLKMFYKVGDGVKDWVMGSAAKKWRDFKADLKALYFDEEKTDEELLAVCDERVHEDGWKWLIEYWRGDEAKDRSKRGKLNHEKMALLHTAGSKSYARVGHEMHKENGYAPRRDEVFLKTHTQRSGELANKEAAAKLKALEDAANDRLELLEKTVKQGDLLSHVFGKEKNRHVRCIGLGAKCIKFGHACNKNVEINKAPNGCGRMSRSYARGCTFEGACGTNRERH